MRLYSTIHSGIGLNLSNICDETMDSFKYARVFHSVVLYMRFCHCPVARVSHSCRYINAFACDCTSGSTILRMKNIENNTCSVI